MDHNVHTRPAVDDLMANLRHVRARLSRYTAHRRDRLHPQEDSDELARLYGQCASHLRPFLEAVYTFRTYPAGEIESQDEFRRMGGIEAFLEARCGSTDETDTEDPACPYRPIFAPHRPIARDLEGGTDDDS